MAAVSPVTHDSRVPAFALCGGTSRPRSGTHRPQLSEKAIRVLFVSFIGPHYIELARVARGALENSAFEPVIAFGTPYESCAQDASRAKADGFNVASETCPQISAARPEVSPPSSRGGMLKRMRAGILRSAVSTPLWIRYERRQIERAAACIAKYRPSVIVMAEDNPGYPTGNWIAAARRKGIPVVIVPYTVAGPLEAAESLFRNPEYSSERTANRLLAARLPRWFYRHRGVGLVRLPAARAIAKEITGCVSRAPWLLNTGDVTAIAAESERMKLHYVNHGIPEQKVRITGAAADDTLAAVRRRRAALRQQLEAQHGLVSGRPLLLCAMPPDQFAFSADQTEFDSYDALVRAWAGALTRMSGWNVVVRPHPRDAERTTATLSGTGVTVSLADTASLVPLCDLYVASISATIRWAIACGIPVVNYDCYRLRYGDYAGVGGVINVEDFPEFSAAMSRFADDDYRERLTAAQRATASQWGELDGRAMQRILALIESVPSQHAA